MMIIGPAGDSPVTAPEATGDGTTLEEERDSGPNPECWSPRYEFDAPHFLNFSRPKYQESGRLLNRLVLHIEDAPDEPAAEDHPAAEEPVPEAEDDFGSDDLDEEHFFRRILKSQTAGDSSDLEGDAWFQRFHPLHEPMRPQTPPGPLITPERAAAAGDAAQAAASLGCCTLRTRLFANYQTNPASSPARLSSPRKAHLPFSSPHSSPQKLLRSPTAFTMARGQHAADSDGSQGRSSYLSSPASPTRPAVPLGLKAKPARVLKAERSAPSSSPLSTVNADSPAVPPRSPLKKTFTALKRSCSHGHDELRFNSLTLNSRRQSLKKNRKDEVAATTVAANPANPAKSHHPRAKTVNLDDLKKLLNQHNSKLRPKR